MPALFGVQLWCSAFLSNHLCHVLLLISSCSDLILCANVAFLHLGLVGPSVQRDEEHITGTTEGVPS